MPFDVTMPDGTLIQNVPDGTTQADIQARYAAHQAQSSQPQAPQSVSTLGDMVRAIPSGLAELPASILGTLTHPGAIAQRLLAPLMGRETANKAAGFADIGAQATMPNAAGAGQMASSAAAFQPQTVPGQYAKTISSFAPAALGGEGGILARGARVLAPALASETAGQLTKGTSAEPWARLAGGLAGGMGESMLEGGPKAPPLPTTGEIKDASQRLYESANQAGVVVKNDALKSFASDVGKTIADEGLSKRLHPAALGALQDIQDAAESGQPVTLKGLDLLRQNIGDVAATSANPGERRLAGIMRGKMDDFMGNIGPGDVLAGDPKQATQVLSQARDLWQTYKKSALIDDLIDGAKNRSNFTASGFENGLRTEFRALAQSNTKMRQFTQEEQDAIRTVVRGGPLDNFFRAVGRFSVRGPVSGMGAAMAERVIPGAGFALSGIGEGARHLATNRTMSNIEQLQNLIKGNAPAASSGSAQSLLSGTMLQQLLRSGTLPALLGNPAYQTTAQ